MDFGVHLPHLGRNAERDVLISFAEEADRLGYHSAWTSDHIVGPASVDSIYPYSEDGSFPAPYDMAWLDPIATLLFVASRTENIKLGVTVMVIGYRMPIQTAKNYATLDQLSNGRAILGVGIGWNREEFEALGMPWDNRGKRADEMLDLYEVLFTEQKPSFDGKYYQVPDLYFEPKPVNGHIPVWIGGDTEPAWRRTVERGDVFHAAFEKADNIDTAWKRIGELCEEKGRDVAELGLSVRYFLDFDNLAEPEKSVAGSAEEMYERLGQLAEIGVDHVLLDPVARGGAAGKQEAIVRFGEEIMPNV